MITCVRDLEKKSFDVKVRGGGGGGEGNSLIHSLHLTLSHNFLFPLFFPVLLPLSLSRQMYEHGY